MSTVPPDNRCDVCKSKGLAVYMPRYTAVPKAFTAPALGPFSGEKVKSVALTQSKYALRQLREGFVYVFYELGPCGKFYWDAYSVAPDGSLWKQLDAASAKSVNAPQACSRDGHNALRTLFIVIEQPDQCGKVWVAFSERKWSAGTLTRYGGKDAAGAALRAERMQALDPAKWIAEQTAARHKAPLTPENLKHVIEFAPQTVVGKTGEASALPNKGLPAKVSTGAKGAFLQKQLEACSTLYPWSMHTKAPAQGAAGDADQLIAQAKASSVAGCAPMMLALWDGIGMTHELNGFRNDAQARFLQYCDEESLQINALEWIDQAKQAVRASAQNKATFDNSPAVSGSASYYYPDAVAKQKAAAKTPEEKQFWSDYEWMGQNGVPPSYARNLTQFRTIPSSSPYQDTMTRARAYVANKSKMESDRDKRIAQDTDSGAKHDWAKYEKQLAGDAPGKADPKLLETFRGFYEDIRQKKQKLLGLRTADVDAWLGAPLWIDTLEDYHEHDLPDGIAFEFVIFKGIVGLNADPQGVAVLNKLIDRLDATKPESLVWRMVASNQKQSKEALKLALARADAHKETILKSVGEGYDTFAEASEKLKKFAEVFQKMEEMSKQVKQLNKVDQLVHDKGVDKAMVAVGTLIFKRFGFKGFNLENLGNAVGEGIIHAVFLSRAGISDKDVRELVVKQALVEPQLRRQFLTEFERQRKIGHNRLEAFHLANAAVAESQGSQLLASRWKEVRTPANVGVVTVVAAIEIFGLIKLIKKSDKEGRDYAELMGACFSVAGATAEVVMKPLEALKLEHSAQSLKILGGYCGAVAAGVGATLDLQDADAKYHNGERFVGLLYFGKGVIGVAATGAFVLTALSSSAPFLERLAPKVVGRRVFVLLGRIGTGVADATARKAAIAAGKAATDAAIDIAAERVAMMWFGRALLFMASWEVQVAIIAIQVLIWIFANDDLQNAITQSVFGTEQKYKEKKDLKKQDESFDKALVAVGLKSEEASKGEEASKSAEAPKPAKAVAGGGGW